MIANPYRLDIYVDINKMPHMLVSTANDIGSVCLGLHIRRAARALTRLYDNALVPVDLTIGQFSLMTMLAGHERWSMQPLADALGTDRSSLTAALKPLERRSLVCSSPDVADRRLRYLSLTVEGNALLDEARPLWDDAQQQAEGMIGKDAASTLRDTLRAIT